MTVEVTPFAETWGVIMDIYIEAEAAGDRETAIVANDLLEEMAMGEPKDYLDMITTRRMGNVAINK